MNSKPLSRRTVLKGIGVSLSLPLLDAMLPGRLFGAASGAAKPPVRLVFMHSESGIWMDKFKPAKTGADYKLSHILEPLADFKPDFSVCSGLFHANAFKPNPILNRHEQDAIQFLTAADLGRVPGVAARNGVSIDQVAARSLGEHTRLSHLHLVAGGGGNICYSESGSPIPGEGDPLTAFNRMFGDQSVEARKQSEIRYRQNKSLLDETIEAAKTLTARLGASDRSKLDEYLTNVREVERRAQVALKRRDVPIPKLPLGVTPPAGNSRPTRTEAVRALMDVAALAIQTDQTRVITLQIGFMNCQYPEIDCPDGYHNYTHHDHKQEKIDGMIRVDRKRVEHVAYFLGKLKGIQEADQNVLYNSSILYGSGMGQTHPTTDLPNLLLGHGGGQLRPGKHIDYRGKPLTNLFLTMLETAGIHENSFADSTGPLDIFHKVCHEPRKWTSTFQVVLIPGQTNGLYLGGALGSHCNHRCACCVAFAGGAGGA